MFRRLLCLFGIHSYGKQKDPFGFGDDIEGCKYCDAMKIKVDIKHIK